MKYLLTTIIALCAINTFAQPFFGIGISNHGFIPSVGVVSNGIAFTLATKLPLTHTDVPVIHSLTVGKQLMLTDQDDGNYSLTISAGPALYRVKDFTAYDADLTGHAAIVQVSVLRPVVAIEFTQDMFCGRWYINASYCKGAWFGIGIKAFLNR